MESRVSYTLVGVFAISLSIALVSGLLWLGHDAGDRVYETYLTYMRESVSGLSPNAPVKYRGVDVGRVNKILLDPNNPEQVQLVLEIASGTPMKADTQATLSVQGLTGLAFVELTGGSKESPPLSAQPGQPYPIIHSRPSLLVRMDDSVSLLLANLNSIALDLRALVDEENRRAFGQLLTNTAKLSETFASREAELARLLSSTERTVSNVERITADLPALTTHLTTQLPKLTSRLTESVEALQGMARDISQTSQTARTLLTEQNVGYMAQQTLAEVGLLVGELRQLTASFQRLSQQVEQEPNVWLFGRRTLPRGPGE